MPTPNTYLFREKTNESNYICIKGYSPEEALAHYKQEVNNRKLDPKIKNKCLEWVDNPSKYILEDVSNVLGTYFSVNVLIPDKHSYSKTILLDVNFKLGDYMFLNNLDPSQAWYVKASTIEQAYDKVHHILRNNNVVIPDWLLPHGSTGRCLYFPVDFVGIICYTSLNLK
jgi:hypothetical protein